MTQPALISAIESVTHPLQQSIASLTSKVDNLTELVKDDIHNKKIEGFLQELRTIQAKIVKYEKILEDAGLHKKAKWWMFT